MTLHDLWARISGGRTAGEAAEAARRAQRDLASARRVIDDVAAQLDEVRRERRAVDVERELKTKEAALLRDELGVTRACVRGAEARLRAAQEEASSLRDWRRMEIARADNEAGAWIARANAQRVEVLRVRDTLAFYADPNQYEAHRVVADDGVSATPAPVLDDRGQKARDALADFLA